MAGIGTPYLIGTASAGSATTITMSPSTATGAGDLIVVCTDCYYPYGVVPVSVTDTASNTYTKVYFPGLVANPNPTMYVAQNTTALTTVSTITVTWSQTGQPNAVALGCSGVASSGAVDQIAYLYGVNNTLTLITGQLGLPNELAVVYWVARQAQGAPAPDSSWTSLSNFQGQANTHYVNAAYQIEDTASPVNASASTPSSGTGWSGLLVTFREQINPTASGACGGSATAYAVLQVNGSSLAPCGGSALQPATPAPYAPPVIPVFPAGYSPQQSDFTAWIQESTGYLTAGIVFRAEQTVAQSLTAATYANMAFGQVSEDPFSGWSATATANQPANSWLAPYTGWFRVTFRYTVGATSAWLDAALSLTGGFPLTENESVLVPAAYPGGAGLSLVVAMIGGTDYLQFQARSSSSATTSTAVGLRASVEIVPSQTQPSNYGGRAWRPRCFLTTRPPPSPLAAPTPPRRAPASHGRSRPRPAGRPHQQASPSSTSPTRRSRRN